MNSNGARAWRRLGAFAALCLTIALGDSRTNDSRVVVPPSDGDPASLVSISSDDDGLATATAPRPSADELHLVPAIYARDPDVSFIYFRQVSKWM